MREKLRKLETAKSSYAINMQETRAGNVGTGIRNDWESALASHIDGRNSLLAQLRNFTRGLLRPGDNNKRIKII